VEKSTATIVCAEKRMGRPWKHGHWIEEVVSLMIPHLLSNEPDTT